jgi:hypothetical protein
VGTASGVAEHAFHVLLSDGCTHDTRSRA